MKTLKTIGFVGLCVLTAGFGAPPALAPHRLMQHGHLSHLPMQFHFFRQPSSEPLKYNRIVQSFSDRADGRHNANVTGA